MTKIGSANELTTFQLRWLRNKKTEKDFLNFHRKAAWNRRRGPLSAEKHLFLVYCERTVHLPNEH